jgi:transcriptional regulator with XRE-family HTH domain
MGARLIDMGSRNAGEGSVAGGDAGFAEGSVAFEGQPIGSYLRLQREIRGISAEELALQTRIPLRSLERLESGSFDGETDGFVRGFVRTVADALGLDPDDTISRMLAEPKLEESSRIDLSVALSRAFVGVAVVVLMAAAIGLVKAVGMSGEAASSGIPLSEQVYRRDPVRALAEAQAAIQADRLVAAELSVQLPLVSHEPAAP